jgi:hypothetical protein
LQQLLAVVEEDITASAVLAAGLAVVQPGQVLLAALEHMGKDLPEVMLPLLIHLVKAQAAAAQVLQELLLTGRGLQAAALAAQV